MFIILAFFFLVATAVSPCASDESLCFRIYW